MNDATAKQFWRLCRNLFRRRPKLVTDDELMDMSFQHVGGAFHQCILNDVKTVEQRQAFELVASMMLKRLGHDGWLDVVSFTGVDLKEPFEGRKPNQPDKWGFQPQP